MTEAIQGGPVNCFEGSVQRIEPQGKKDPYGAYPVAPTEVKILAVAPIKAERGGARWTPIG